VSSFQWLLACPDTINGLGVTTFGSQLGRWNSVLNWFGHSGNSVTLAPIQMSSQETVNTNSIDNFLNFPMVVNPSSLGNSLRVMIYGSWWLLLKFCFGQYEVTWVIWSSDHLWSENPVTLKTNIVGVPLRFLTHPYTTYSGKHHQSYRDLKSRNLETNLVPEEG
jgi:hypothetical protein